MRNLGASVQFPGVEPTPVGGLFLPEVLLHDPVLFARGQMPRQRLALDTESPYYSDLEFYAFPGGLENSKSNSYKSFGAGKAIVQRSSNEAVRRFDKITAGPKTYLIRVRFQNLLGKTFGDTNNGTALFSTRTADGNNSPTLCVSDAVFTNNVMRFWVGLDRAGVARGSYAEMTVETDTWYTVAARLSETNANLLIVINGKKYTMGVANQVGTYSTAWAGSESYLGWNPQWPQSGNNNADMQIELFCAIDRALSTKEMISLTRDPYQLVVSESA